VLTILKVPCLFDSCSKRNFGPVIRTELMLVKRSFHECGMAASLGICHPAGGRICFARLSFEILSQQATIQTNRQRKLVVDDLGR